MVVLDRVHMGRTRYVLLIAELLVLKEKSQNEVAEESRVGKGLIGEVE